MFAGFISLTLIVSVIACPVSCGSGGCHSSQCCAAEAVSPGNDGGESCVSRKSDVVAPAVSNGCCCCDNAATPGHDKSSGETSDGNYPVPHPHRNACECQGICGGAVLEKPSRLDGAEATFLLPLPADKASILLLSASRADRRRIPAEISVPNHGRALRTRNRSLIC